MTMMVVGVSDCAQAGPSLAPESRSPLPAPAPRRFRWRLLLQAALVLSVATSACAPAAILPSASPALRPEETTCPTLTGGPVDNAAVVLVGPSASFPPSPILGERMVLQGVFVLPSCAVASRTIVKTWHEDAAGHYGPIASDHQPTCCYYEATFETDQNGRFELHTIRPATDPATDGTAELEPHMHFAIQSAASIGPDSVVVFAGEDNGPDTSFAAVVQLEKRTDSIGAYWFGFVRIRVSPPAR